jgi:hypothetical protein
MPIHAFLVELSGDWWERSLILSTGQRLMCEPAVSSKDTPSFSRA